VDEISKIRQLLKCLQICGLFLACLVWFAGCARVPRCGGDTCLPYEPGVETIRGVLLRETQPGPPNYESIEAGDEPIMLWSLKTTRSYCMPETGELFENEISGITEFHLVLNADQYEAYRHLVGQEVAVTGSFYQRHTGRHFKPILVNVFDLKAIQQQKE